MGSTGTAQPNGAHKRPAQNLRRATFSLVRRRLPTALLLFVTALSAAEFRSEIPQQERVWIGPQYWANPLQDWRIDDGRIENAVSGGNRNVFLLTHELGADSAAGFEMSVRLGRLGTDREGWAGFRIGVKSRIDDYRYAALRGKGLNVGVTAGGKPFVGDDQARAAMLRRIASMWGRSLGRCNATVASMLAMR